MSLQIGSSSALRQTSITIHLEDFHVYGIRGMEHLATRITKRVWISQLPLKIYCGDQFVCNSGAVMNYLEVLTDNLTIVLLLTKYIINAMEFHISFNTLVRLLNTNKGA